MSVQLFFCALACMTSAELRLVPCPTVCPGLTVASAGRVPSHWQSGAKCGHCDCTDYHRMRAGGFKLEDELEPASEYALLFKLGPRSDEEGVRRSQEMRGAASADHDIS